MRTKRTLKLSPRFQVTVDGMKRLQDLTGDETNFRQVLPAILDGWRRMIDHFERWDSVPAHNVLQVRTARVCLQDVPNTIRWVITEPVPPMMGQPSPRHLSVGELRFHTEGKTWVMTFTTPQAFRPPASATRAS